MLDNTDGASNPAIPDGVLRSPNGEPFVAATKD
jgi:hypothetical protein